jgi:hypothetical protein
MPKGKYTLADVAPDQPQQAGKYTAADIDTSAPASLRPAGLPEGQDLPGFPSAPAVNMTPSALGQDATPGTAGQRLFGDKPISNTVSEVYKHAKNIVAAPYHAVADAPQGNDEDAVSAGQGPLGLGAYRAFIKPTLASGSQVAPLAKSGDYAGAANAAMDAIPIAGPWARGIENEAQSHGAIPSLLGLATDFAAPKVAGKLFGGTANNVGKGMQAIGSTPEAVKVAATRGLVTGSPGEMLNRSLKPPVTMPDFEQSIEASLPMIAKQGPKGVSGFAEAANKAKAAEQGWYQGLKAPFAADPIDTTPAVQRQIGSIPATNLFETPEIVGRTTKRASPYDMTPQTQTVTSPLLDQFGKPIKSTVTTTPTKPTLDTVDDIRQDTNAKLRAFYDQTSGDRNAALSNPETARTKAVNDATRDLVYNHLSQSSGVPVDKIAENQNLYGHLSDVAQVAGKRATVAGRANPLSLQESLQLHGNPLSQAYNFGTSRLFKNLTDSDAVTNAAVDRYLHPDDISLPPRPTLFGKTASAAGSGVRAASKLNPFFAPSVAAKGDRRGAR